MKIYLSYGLTLLLITIGITIQFNTLIIPDLGWHLYVAQKILTGKKLYLDYFEVNLPMMFYLTLIPATFTKIIGTNAILTLKIFNVIITTLSLLYTFFLTRKDLAFNHKPLFLIGLAYILFIVPICFPEFELGQKEHFFIALTLPYILSFFLRLNKFHLFTVALLAAVGFAIKPFFILFFIVIEILKLIFFDKYNKTPILIISVFLLLYYFNLYIFHPEYLGLITPLALNSYVYLTPEGDLYSFFIYFIRVTLEIYGGFIFISLLGLIFITNNKTRIVLSALIFTSLVIVFIQQKCFWYHYLPTLSMCALTATFGVIMITEHLKLKTMKSYFYFLWLLFTGFVFITYPLEYAGNILKDRKAEYFAFENIKNEIEQNKVKNILIISNDISSSFPIINYTDVEWTARQHSQQLLDGLNNARLSEEEYKFTLDYIVDDVVQALSKRPDMVIIREPKDEGGTSSLAHFFNKRFTYVKFFKQFKAFENQWQSYQYSHTLDNSLTRYSIYLRKEL